MLKRLLMEAIVLTNTCPAYRLVMSNAKIIVACLAGGH